MESKTGDVFAKYIKGKIEIHYRQDGKLKRRKSVWTDTKFDSSTYGTEILTSLIGENNFPFPKSIYAVKECIESATQNKEAYILDFFAGSGTTGHSAMLLNKEDGGKRKFILCTNNENGIANEILYPRIKTVINGVENLKELTFIPSNVRYFKTNFVSKSSVSDDTRNSLVRKSTEMICVREDTFDKVLDKKEFKLYRNNNLVTGILFDLDELDRFKEELSKLKLSAHIYVFSLTNDTYASDFENLKIKNTLCPIPESILEVYRKLFKE